MAVPRDGFQYIDLMDSISYSYIKNTTSREFQHYRWVEKVNFKLFNTNGSDLKHSFTTVFNIWL